MTALDIDPLIQAELQGEDELTEKELAYIHTEAASILEQSGGRADLASVVRSKLGGIVQLREYRRLHAESVMLLRALGKDYQSVEAEYSLDEEVATAVKSARVSFKHMVRQHAALSALFEKLGEKPVGNRVYYIGFSDQSESVVKEGILQSFWPTGRIKLVHVHYSLNISDIFLTPEAAQAEIDKKSAT